MGIIIPMMPFADPTIGLGITPPPPLCEMPRKASCRRNNKIPSRTASQVSRRHSSRRSSRRITGKLHAGPLDGPSRRLSRDPTRVPAAAEEEAEEAEKERKPTPRKSRFREEMDISLDPDEWAFLGLPGCETNSAGIERRGSKQERQKGAQWAKNEGRGRGGKRRGLRKAAADMCERTKAWVQRRAESCKGGRRESAHDAVKAEDADKEEPQSAGEGNKNKRNLTDRVSRVFARTWHRTEEMQDDDPKAGGGGSKAGGSGEPSQET
ncbi:hypothetical protein NKR23_g638 [Pleurostoma richardsiae]|uniref:Uncharacterized protein n=1 Tax=Pleurostoma richardsiae TaxID=41990 RepID=A0AA38VQH1_9PEZI|nr:hypothetical protein NKR23_g638 [Pleurostoma richardsiae]